VLCLGLVGGFVGDLVLAGSRAVDHMHPLGGIGGGAEDGDGDGGGNGGGWYGYGYGFGMDVLMGLGESVFFFYGLV
jgi:hypothetical protein